MRKPCILKFQKKIYNFNKFVNSLAPVTNTDTLINLNLQNDEKLFNRGEHMSLTRGGGGDGGMHFTKSFKLNSSFLFIYDNRQN